MIFINGSLSILGVGVTPCRVTDTIIQIYYCHRDDKVTLGDEKSLRAHIVGHPFLEMTHATFRYDLTDDIS